jgi:uncharacterized secreted protein with C-terminal beta-propeller domain
MIYVGVNNIAVSQIDDTVFISNATNIDLGTTSSFAIYGADGNTSIVSTGNACVWNEGKSRLEVIEIKTNNIYSENITTNHIKTDNIITTHLTTEYIHSRQIHSADIFLDGYFHAPKVSVGNWLGFRSKDDETHHCFRLQVKQDKSGANCLKVIASVNKNKPETEIIRLDTDRTSFLTTLNLKSNIVKSSVGVAGDKKGDVAIDENYFFYCTKNFNGVSKIWKRVELSSW